MTPRTHIVIHHSLTKDGTTVSWAAIEKFHREVQGWRDIGYHAGVELVTNDPELTDYRYQALFGRPPYAQASACPQGGMNRVGLHVCCVGNYDLEAPSMEMLKMLVRRIILPWMTEYGISPEYIVGHRDFNPGKSCPGSKFLLDVVRGMVR